MHLFLQLAPFALLTGGMAVCATLFVSLKKEMHVLKEGMRTQQLEMAQADKRIRIQLNELDQGIRQSDERTGIMVQPTPTKSGLNLNKRSQVMKMSRHGENAENIAVALGLPRNEVDLLLKVQRIVLSSATQAAAS